jgi:amino acid adenylation domain-containing protein
MSTRVHSLDTAPRRENIPTARAFRSSIEFWRDQLKGQLPVLDLPIDRRRRPDGQSGPYREIRFSLPSNLVIGMRCLAEQEGTSLFCLYLTTYAVLLSRYCNTTDVFIGTSSATGVTSDLVAGTGDGPDISFLRGRCEPDVSFRALLQPISELLSAAQENYVPFPDILNLVSTLRPAGRGSVSDAYFIWESENHRNRTVPFTSAQDIESLQSSQGPFDIALRIQYTQQAVKPSLAYREDLFEPTTIQRMSRHWLRLIESVIASPETAICRLDMMPEEERALVLGAYAGANADYPRMCLHELFARQAAERPDAEALVFGTTRLTYQQLDERSNQIAHFLRNEGIAPEDPIGIFMDRSAEMIVCMLGILKAGGAYVPIDPDYPEERLSFIANDIAFRLVLTEHRVRTKLTTAAPLIEIDGPDSSIAACSKGPVANVSTPESLAVVIYTSGSTGQPKAACIPHRAAVRTVCSTNHIDATPADRMAQVASPSFDAAIMEIWLALVNGATLVGMRRETLLDHSELKKLIQKEKLSILILNTAYVHQIGRDAPELLKGVRKVMFGGEAAEPGPLREILHSVGPGVLVNGYGPAEGCVITTYHEITSIPESAATVPIGRPVTNAQLYLLDGCGQPVPIGVPGEICIGGEGIARGYWNRPQLTAERFIPDPFSGTPGRPLYRTGDIGRMRENGEFEFVGRADEQIKIRGYRIELAEVRAAIVSQPDVKQVFLMVREDQPGDKRLVAYVTARREISSFGELLREHVKSKLPSHMIPGSFIILDSIPLNTNGKVDRKALPAQQSRIDSAAGYKPPQTDLERRLVKIWQQLLRMDRIGVNDNFFELGGHSLLAARLIARIEEQTGHRLSAKALLEGPTVAQLAQKLSSTRGTTGEQSIIELRPAKQSGHAKPFFCVLWNGTNLVTFHKISLMLRGDGPVYGVQPSGLYEGSCELPRNLEKLAAIYVDEIRKKQPYGPYQLGGICVGGVLAFEIAQQLRAAGQEVSLLALIDSFLPGKLQYLHERSRLATYLDNHIGEILLLPRGGRLRYFAKWFANGGRRVARILGWREPEFLIRHRRAEEEHLRTVLAYKPKPYSGRITHFVCSDGPQRTCEDRRLAWSAFAEHGMEIQLVPGDHFTWVEDSRIAVLAEKLQRCLDRILANDEPKPKRIHPETSPEKHSHQSIGRSKKVRSVAEFTRVIR